METQKKQVVDSLKKAMNVLVTVSSNPSVDQLAGAIGLTLILNKLGKHATTVFSGAIPSTIDFLQPEKTIEKNTDSLRDFIIALDKSKADKLRYKVEDQMVKIFITPYMTSISEKDLEFSQGDFNVDVILALGVHEQQDLDQAITTHGRILHDATLIGVSNQADTALGSIKWTDPAASSLCEMLTQLGIVLKEDVLDNQMSTALLTGIVAETSRFSNEKTSAETMQISSKLMAAGANQQLVASQLQPPLALPTVPDEPEHTELPEITQADDLAPIADPLPPAETRAADGTLQIDHEELKKFGLDAEAPAEAPETETEPEIIPESPEPPADQIHIDEEGILKPKDQQDVSLPEVPVQADETPEPAAEDPLASRFILDPPTMGGRLTANSEPETLDPSLDILGPLNDQGPLLNHGDSSTYTPSDEDATDAADEPEKSQESQQDETIPLPEVPFSEPLPSLSSVPVETPLPPLPLSTAASEPAADTTLPPLPPLMPEEAPSQTLADLEQSIASSEQQPDTVTEGVQQSDDGGLDAARDAVSQAMSGSATQILEPVQSLNAQPMDLNLGDIPAVNTSPASAFPDSSLSPGSINPFQDASATDSASLPTLTPYTSEDNSNTSDATSGSVTDPNAPPPVPPPMMPPITPPLGSDDPTVM